MADERHGEEARRPDLADPTLDPELELAAGDERARDDAALEALALTLATEPPAELRSRVLLEVRRAAELERSERRLRRWRISGAIALAAALALAVLSASQVRESARSLADLRSLAVERETLANRLEAQGRELSYLEDALAVQSEVVRIVTSPRLITVSLRPESGGPGSARVVLDPDSGRVAVLGAGLPPPQAGRVYELWAIRNDGVAEAAGPLTPTEDEAFAVRRQVPRPSEVRRFTISLEEAPGAVRPTGPIVLTGAVEQR